MRIASIMMGVVGGVVLVTCVLTVFFFPLDSMLLWGKVSVGLGMVLAALALNWEGVRNAVSKKSTTFVTTSVVMTLGVAVFLGAINYLAAVNKKEVDLTKDGVFTLSDQSEKALQALVEPVTVVAFFRKDEPEGSALDDLVERYTLLSDKVKLQLVNPDQNPQLVEKYKVTAQSPRIIVESRGQEARVKDIREEGLTNAIVQVSQRAKKLYLTQGHGEPGLQTEDADGIKATVEDLGSEGYEVSPLNIIDAEGIPADTGVLVVMGPRKAFFPPEVEVIKGFLAEGGKMLLMVEPGMTTGLEEILKSYRLELGNNTVLDSSQFGRLFGQGPDAAIVFQYEPHKSTEGMEGTASVFKSARSVTVLPGDEQIHALTLVSSQVRSWGETKLLEGDWQWNDGELRGPVPMVALTEANTVEVKEKLSDTMRLMVFGDVDLATNQYRVLAANRDLLLNSVAFLAEEEAKISIRPKNRGASRIVLTPTQEAFIAFFALDGMPVTLLAFGLGIWLVRRRR